MYYRNTDNIILKIKYLVIIELKSDYTTQFSRLITLYK